MKHVVKHQPGDLPVRLETCSLRGCGVDGDGATTCQHLACPSCGVGPPVLLQPEEVFYCDQCWQRWRPFGLPV